MDDPQFLRAKPHADRREVTAYVTVMKGCDERCTFCIVPYTRGSERYRPADEIVGEIRDLVAGGVREITLLGQTVNSWHEPGADAEASKSESRMAASTSRFAGLLRRIAKEVPDLQRLRYTSPHPRHITPELVAAHAELDVLPTHVHLPVQSGSDRVLRRMARRYTAEDYIARTDALKGAKPGLTLSSDFIVGFPGETEEDFEQTLELARRVGFVAAFAFKYSPRPYTPALKLGDEVSEEVKDERLARLFAVIETQQLAHLQSLVGQELQVLVEGPSPGDTGRFAGRSERNEIVHLIAPKGYDPTGELVTVMIDQPYRHSLSGYMTGADGQPERGRRTRLSVLDAGGAT
jgi:tRNA-2-methylthio-N6-dimethylallyladenosine synthase